MDRATAIEENRTALLEVVSGLFTMLGHLSGAVLGRIPRFLYRTVFRDLRPAEAAVRRLIVLAAIGLKVKLAPYRPMPKDKKISKNKGTNTRPAFRLDDPRLPLGPPRRRGRYRKFGPRIHARPYDTLEARPAPPSDDGQVDGARLARRLEAIRATLEDIPKQAGRLARRKARRERVSETCLIYTSPLRHGALPFRRGEPETRAEVLLHECNWLVHQALCIDTS